MVVGKKRATQAKRAVPKKTSAESASQVQPKRGRGGARKATPKEEAPVLPPSQESASSSVDVQPKGGRGGARKIPLKEQVGECSSPHEQEHDSDGNSNDELPVLRDRLAENDIQMKYLTYDKHDSIDVDELYEALTREERRSGMKNHVIKSVTVDCVRLCICQLKYLLRCVLFHTKVERLVIANIGYGDQIARLIARYLMHQKKKSLRELHLINVEMGYHGAILLGRALILPGCTLTKLYLHHCNLNEEAISQLVVGLQHNTSLNSVTLEKMPVGPDTIKAIGSMLMVNGYLGLLTINVNEGALRYLTERLTHTDTALSRICVVKTDLERKKLDLLAPITIFNLSPSDDVVTPAFQDSLMNFDGGSILMLDFQECVLTDADQYFGSVDTTDQH